jgi:hypothetical protein
MIFFQSLLVLIALVCLLAEQCNYILIHQVFAVNTGQDRSFLERHQGDLYVSGNPAHPLTFINGILDLIRSK